MILKIAKQLYTTPPREWKTVFKNGESTHRAPSYAFLTSPEYDALMLKYLPFPGKYDLHEAQNRTANFLFRHHEADHELGIFRWRGMHKHKDYLLKLLRDPKLKVADLGGAACPIGFNAEVIDFLAIDKWGKPVPYKFITDVPHALDVVFTSHTLEHIPNLDEVLQQIKAKLNPGGILIAHVPSFYCERWRVGNHRNPEHQDHVWTFGLANTPHPKGLTQYTDIDARIGQFFDIKLAEYCGDDSILVIAEKAKAS